MNVLFYWLSSRVYNFYFVCFGGSLKGGVGYIRGEKHEVLREGDFAVAFINATMKNKLLNFHNIICMDGTHGTNKNRLELTFGEG
jgi:hypothetical protein